MRRFLLSASVGIAGMLLLAVPHERGHSVEQMFVAQTQAAGMDATCTMPPMNEDGQEPQRLAVPTSSNAGGGDLPPVRMVVDPYPSFNGVVVDSVNDLVMMSDTNR